MKADLYRLAGAGFVIWGLMLVLSAWAPPLLATLSLMLGAGLIGLSDGLDDGGEA